MIPVDSAPLVTSWSDDAAVRDSLCWRLESAGYRVFTYPTAERFLIEADPRAAVCLILDVHLPGMSGLDLQETLNARGGAPPIIFISGHALVPIAVEAMKNGACHFLEKPVGDAQLLQAIDQARARCIGRDVTAEKPAP